jgi:hypothetical protein
VGSVAGDLAHETLRVRDVSSWWLLMRYTPQSGQVRLGQSCADEVAREHESVFGLVPYSVVLILGVKRGALIGSSVHTQILNFEVDIGRRDHEELSTSRIINMTHHSSQVSADLIWEIARTLPCDCLWRNCARRRI